MLNEALAAAERRLAAAGVASPRAEALLLLEAAVGVDRISLLTQLDRPLLPGEGAALAELLRRRVTREPLQHILGEAPFYGLMLAVTEDVLVPRPETERLVEIVLTELAGESGTVLDVGCGSGAIALALKSERPDLDVWATDVSGAALSVARANAERLGLEVTFRRSDLLADSEVATAAAHCVALVSNPPYLPESDRLQVPLEVRSEPELALFAGADGLEVARRLARQARGLLPPRALFALELDERNVAELATGLRDFGSVAFASDLTGRRRFVVARR